jgi:hypothetical protein
MKRPILFAYQLATGVSDTFTGILLCVDPSLALRMMGVHAPADAKPYISYIGAFVLSVGLACLYGAHVVHSSARIERIEAVWLLTAFSRTAVALYLLSGIAGGMFEPAWMSVVLFDGACVVIQGIGMRRGWLRDAQ